MVARAPTYEEIAAGLRNANDEALEPDGQRYALTLLHTLAEGEPVSAVALAERTGQSAAQAAAFIDRLRGIYRDDDGRVIGMWGLAVTEFPPHRYRIDGRQLFTWCAWDPFILTDWLGGAAEVSSVDTHTKEPVVFRIEVGRAVDLSHEGLVLSFKLVDEWTSDVIGSFCHFVHYFTGEQSARAWTEQHPDTFVLSIDDAIRLGRLWGRQVFPDLEPATVLGPA